MKARTITISRQYGSGGHEVAKKLSEALGLPCYDNEVISLAAKESGAQLWEFQMAENLRDTNFIYNLSMIAPHSDIQEEPYSVKLFRAQSEAMAELAERGPAVFVGRCGNFVLRQDPEAVHFFICGSLAKRTERWPSMVWPSGAPSGRWNEWTGSAPPTMGSTPVGAGATAPITTW